MTVFENCKEFTKDDSQEYWERLLIDNKQTLTDLADFLCISRTTKGWEIIVLNVCLFFNDCFNYFTEVKGPNESPHDYTMRKYITQMREIASFHHNHW